MGNGVFPFEVDSRKFCTFPVFSYFIVFTQGGLQVLDMLFSHILYAEVVDEQAKLDGAPFCFIVACFIEALAQEVISQSSTLREAITAFDYFEEYPSIVLICE